MKAAIKCKGVLAGWLEMLPGGLFRFSYENSYLNDPGRPAVSLNLPKSAMPHDSVGLHPFFFNMLPEGETKLVLCKTFGIAENDAFGLLVRLARHDAPGAVTAVLETDTDGSHETR